jgi:uncharacterized protein (DUF924 family)
LSAYREDCNAWIGDVLAFWFTELERKDWFCRDVMVDDAIRTRFGVLYRQLGPELLSALVATPCSTLAACIVLDQFPRNMFRGTAAAFATDAKARAVADAAAGQRFDEQLDKEQRIFLYLPFEHSEDIHDQARSVALIAALGDAEYTHYALAHQAVIARFGRFPHRNACLGRLSTPAEVEFFALPGSSF